MDASKITELLQKQNTRYINRSQTVDSSTMIWMNQIRSSKYIKGVATCTGLQNTNVPTQPACPLGNGINTYGGQGKQMTLITGSSQQYPSVFAGADGSASRIYSVDTILLQKAGRNFCAGTITPQDSYTVLPTCECTNTNGPDANNPVVTGNSVITGNPNNLATNNQSNPYLPPFDTYYRFKNKLVSQPVQDQNQKHFVKQCHTRFPDANNGINVLCTDCQSSGYKTCDGCILQQ